MHVLEASGEYVTLRDPAIKLERLAPLAPAAANRTARTAAREIGEVEFARQLMVQAIADGDSRFRAEWSEPAFSLAKAEGVVLVEHYPGPCRTFTGVDLAVGTTSGHDLSALFTIALLADGRRRVLAIEAGDWTAPDIMDRIRATHARYRSTVRVGEQRRTRLRASVLGGGGGPGGSAHDGAEPQRSCVRHRVTGRRAGARPMGRARRAGNA